jgi:hypothetical protein
MTPGVIGTARGQGPRERPAAPASGGTDFVARRQNWGYRSSLRPCWRNGMITQTEQTLFGSVWHPSFCVGSAGAFSLGSQRVLRLVVFCSTDQSRRPLRSKFSAENFFFGLRLSAVVTGRRCRGAGERRHRVTEQRQAASSGPVTPARLWSGGARGASSQMAPFILRTSWLQCTLRRSTRWLNWKRGEKRHAPGARAKTRCTVVVAGWLKRHLPFEPSPGRLPHIARRDEGAAAAHRALRGTNLPIGAPAYFKTKSSQLRTSRREHRKAPPFGGAGGC